MNKINVKFLTKWVFLTGLFLLPLIFWPKAYIPYEIPKVWFFQRWVEVLGVLGVFGILKNPPSSRLAPDFGEASKKDKSKNNKLVYFVFIFVLVGIISSVRGVNFSKSLVGNYYRMDGVLTLLHLAAFFYFVVLFWEEEWRKGTAIVIAGGSILISLWTIVLGVLGRLGILGIFGGSIFGTSIGATFGNPNFLAGYLLVSLPFTIFEVKKLGILGPPSLKLWRVKVLGILVQIIAIILTGSTAGVLGVLLLGGGYLSRGRLKILGILGLLGVLGILSYLSYFKSESGNTQFLPESRQRIIVRGFNGFLKRPILGWGVANFDYAFESNYWPIKFNNDVYVDKAHSNLLEVLVTEGIVGVSIYTGVIILVLRRLLKNFRGDDKGKIKGGVRGNWEETLLFSFFLFLFHSQTNVISINEEMLFWLIAGICVNLNGLSSEAESARIDRHEINKTNSKERGKTGRKVCQRQEN